MNVLNQEQRARIICCLVEGNSIRSTVRMTGIAKNTVTKLLVDIGHACTVFQDKTFRNLKLTKIQCDEICPLSAARKNRWRNQKRATAEAMFETSPLPWPF